MFVLHMVESHLTHLFCEIQLEETCELIGCSQISDRESNQRGRTEATRLLILDPEMKR